MINLEEVCTEIMMASHRAIKKVGPRVFDNPRFKDKTEIVTEADNKSSEAIIAKIKKLKFPCILYDEEAGRLQLHPNPIYTVVTDPADGTQNLWEGKGIFLPFSTAIGIFKGIGDELRYRDVIAGGIMEHTTNKIWTCVKGNGVYCNGKKVDAPLTRKLGDRTRILIDWGYTPFKLNTIPGTDPPQEKIPGLEKFYREMINRSWVTNISGAAYHLALVANGTAGAHLCHGQKPDEMTPSHLMITERGGVVIDYDGNDWSDMLFRFGTSHPAIATQTPELAEDILKVRYEALRPAA